MVLAIIGLFIGVVLIAFCFSIAIGGGSKRHVSGGNEFLAIDFETASSKYFSACSLGLVLFRDGVPIRKLHYLIDPGCKFDPVNIAIHGITPEQISGKPRFDRLWLVVAPMLSKYKVVSYSDFDAKVLKALIRHYKLRASGRIDFVDVYQKIRDVIHGLSNYKLPTVAEYLKIDGLQHHNAQSDAETCGRIYAWLLAHPGKTISAGSGRQATYAQQEYIRNLGGHVPPTLSVSQASRMIDKLIERREEQRVIEAEERARKREQAKADARQVREKERLSAKRKKTEDELQTLAGAMGDPSYKPRKSRTKKMQDLRDFQHLVNRIIADSVIEPSEIIEVKEWLESHKLRPDEFSTTIAAIDAALQDGVVNETETQQLYEKMLDCIIELKERPSV